MTVYKLANICPAHRQTNHQAFISQPNSASHKQQIYSFFSFVFLLFSSLCKLAIILRSCIYFTAVITCSLEIYLFANKQSWVEGVGGQKIGVVAEIWLRWLGGGLGKTQDLSQ